MPQKTYVLVFLALIGLTLLTTGVAFVDLGPLNTVVALAIAFSKMLLVILFFMGVRSSSGLVRIVLIAGFFWLALLIAFTMSDYRTRCVDPRRRTPGRSALRPHTRNSFFLCIFSGKGLRILAGAAQETENPSDFADGLSRGENSSVPLRGRHQNSLSSPEV